MLLLASIGVGTPLATIGDRLSVFIKPGPFLELMGRVGGYNHLKQLGVGSTIVGQLLVGVFGGGLFGLIIRGREITRMTRVTVLIFVLLPVLRSRSCSGQFWERVIAACRFMPPGWSRS